MLMLFSAYTHLRAAIPFGYDSYLNGKECPVFFCGR